MRREPSLTFAGALEILGAQDPSKYSRLSKVLGGVILVSGVATAVATLGPAAAPLAAVAPIWGWVDQKNEAMGLLRDLHSAFRRGLGKAPTRKRRELVAAAHTSIVVSSFFEALRETVGERIYAALEITQQEQAAVALGPHTGLLRALYEAEVPAPSASQGFVETERQVGDWYTALAERTEQFLHGLAGWHRGPLDESLGILAAEKYRERYVDLAAAVPEFRIWASLDEHAATRYAISALAHELSRQRDDLARVGLLLALTAGTPNQQSEPQAVVARANRALLDQQIISPAEAKHLGPVVLPTVGTAFIAPSYRVTETSPQTRVTDESWWSQLPRREDLDIWLASYALSPQATRLPLLLLGHPGAGKSMLMRVLAARLPATDYTVALVPLRAVSANATVVDQIQQALDRSTNKRVSWADLADRSVETVRVIVLDGLDELLQASQHDRSGFLQEVMEFQRVEAEQDRPAIVIVTSRTVVADRVDIPLGAVVLKLDDFDAGQITRWLQAWNESNAVPIAAGTMRGLAPQVALDQQELACQPLLLLILALYSADPDAEPLSEGLSRTALYRDIITSFGRREVLKSGPLPDERMRDAVTAQTKRLCVAALAMFNRGRQTTTEAELTADLVALHGEGSLESEDPGQRLLGEFFFVHTAEATVLGSESGARRRKERRAYEFLHATFGEYLVAYQILDELRDIADTAYSGRRMRDPEDAQLSAILSHQPLAARGSVLTFFLDLFVELAQPERDGIVRVLEFLARSYRTRVAPETFGTYRPTAPDTVRRLACYSANLVILRVLVARSVVPLNEITTSVAEWDSTVGLWKAGLSTDGWHAMLSWLDRSGDSLRASEGDTAVSPVTADYHHAGLLNDIATQARLRWGLVFNDGQALDDGNDPSLAVLAAMCGYTVGRSSMNPSTGVPPGTDSSMTKLIASVAERMLLGWQADAVYVTRCLRLVQEFGRLEEFDPTVLLVNICRHPQILVDMPELGNPQLYREAKFAPLLLRCLAPENTDDGLPVWQSLAKELRFMHRQEAILVSALPDEAVELIRSVIFSMREDSVPGSYRVHNLRDGSERLWDGALR
ncbi:NACHT domain-containing protein [Actinoplanes sp. CA-015351]|uniref:NACHT domain-containing protein n=1 Tax=Actinoplanes sp. CA-015351 TaxID=3239897 RepID=UPI003D95F9EC